MLKSLKKSDKNDSIHTPLGKALANTSSYDLALKLMAEGAVITSEVFEKTPAAINGRVAISLPQFSAITGKTLSWQDRACLLLAGDMQQTIPQTILSISPNKQRWLLRNMPISHLPLAI